MLKRSPATFFSRLTKHLLLKLKCWDQKEQQFFNCPPVKYKVVAGVNSQEAIDFLKFWQPDIIVAFGVPIIKSRTLDQAKIGAINIHGGISPQYKGGNTIFWSLYNGEAELAGATIHHMVKKVDSGSVLAKYYPPVNSGEGEFEVSCKTFKGVALELLHLLNTIAQTGEFPSGEQQQGYSHLYLAKHRTLIKDILGPLKIRKYMQDVNLPERIERSY